MAYLFNIVCPYHDIFYKGIFTNFAIVDFKNKNLLNNLFKKRSSLENNAVTQARVSNDYMTNWNYGIWKKNSFIDNKYDRL